MKTVILDTNFLLISHQFRINVMAAMEKLLHQPHEFVICRAIENELKGIAKGRGRAGIAARVALKMAEKNKFRVLPGEAGSADEWIVNYCAANPGTIVCTNDIILRRALRGTKARIVVMRSRTKVFWA